MWRVFEHLYFELFGKAAALSQDTWVSISLPDISTKIEIGLCGLSHRLLINETASKCSHGAPYFRLFHLGWKTTFSVLKSCQVSSLGSKIYCIYTEPRKIPSRISPALEPSRRHQDEVWLKPQQQGHCCSACTWLSPADVRLHFSKPFIGMGLYSARNADGLVLAGIRWYSRKGIFKHDLLSRPVNFTWKFTGQIRVFYKWLSPPSYQTKAGGISLSIHLRYSQ